MTSYRLRAYLLLLIVSLIWGVAGPIIKFTLGGISSLPFLTYRFAISALIALIFFILSKGRLPKDKKTLALSLLYGFLTSTVALGLLFSGLDKTTVLDMTFITAVGPLLIALSGVFFLKEHVTNQEKLGMGIAFTGSLFTVFEPLFTNGLNISQLTGNFLVILYLLVNTLSSVLVKKLLRKGVEPLTLTNISFIAGFLTITPISLFIHGYTQTIQDITQIAPPFHLGVIYMAVLSGNLAYTLWIKGQKTIEISEAALFSYLYPVFATPLAVIWLKEKFSIPFVIGATLITMGVVVAEYKKKKRN